MTTTEPPEAVTEGPTPETAGWADELAAEVAVRHCALPGCGGIASLPEHDYCSEVHAEAALALAAQNGPPPPPLCYRDEAGLEQALTYCDIGLRYNKRAHAVEHNLNGDWEPLTDRKEQRIRRIIAETVAMPKGEDEMLPYRLSDREWRNYIDALLDEREVDPVLDYIMECSLTATPFEQRPNLLAECGFEIDDTLYPEAYQIWLSWLPIWTIVRRALSPKPVQIDVMPVLIGDPRVGKTTYYKQHSENPGWIAEGFNWKLSHKEKIENAGNASIVLADEMFAAGADIDGMKAWMSFTTPRVRMAYGRYATALWPKYALVGLSNFLDALPDDPTAWDKIAAIQVHGVPYETPIKVTEYWSANRERIYATAYRDVLENMDQIVPPRDLRKHLREAAEMHSYEDEDVALMRAYLRDAEHPSPILLREAAANAGLDADLIKQKKFDKLAAKALKLEGYQQHPTQERPRPWVITSQPHKPHKPHNHSQKTLEADSSQKDPEAQMGGLCGLCGDDGSRSR